MKSNICDEYNFLLAISLIVPPILEGLFQSSLLDWKRVQKEKKQLKSSLLLSLSFLVPFYLITHSLKKEVRFFFFMGFSKKETLPHPPTFKNCITSGEASCSFIICSQLEGAPLINPWRMTLISAAISVVFVCFVCCICFVLVGRWEKVVNHNVTSQKDQNK